MADYKLEQEKDGVVSMAIINKQREELVGLLDQATDGWMDFMQKVGQYLGNATVGRPSKKTLETTMLGPLGFGGWREMIEAEREAGGLEWSYSTWQQWQKAYNVAKLYPELRHRKLTPAEINRFNALAKATATEQGEVNGKGKPLQQATIELWDEAVEAAQHKAEKAKAEKIEQVKTDLSEASERLSKANNQVEALSASLSAEKRLTASLEATVNDLRMQLAESTKTLSCLTATVSEKDSAITRIAGERNKAIDAAKAAEEKARVKIASLTSKLNKLRSLSLLDRLFKKGY